MIYSEVVDRFLKYQESIDRSSETIKGYRKELRYFGNFLNELYSREKNIDEITLEDIEAYMYRMKDQGKMDSTRNRVIYILRSLYNYACKRDLCMKNLPSDIEPIKIKQKERTFLQEEEVRLLFNNIHNPMLKAAIQTLYYTGTRVSELTNLELENLDMDNRLIYVVEGKGNKDRTIPINEKLYKVLDEYLKFIRPDIDSERLFCTKRSGKLSPQYINRTLHQAGKESGIRKRISAHILRHSFASNLIKYNVPLPHLQKLLGHADLRVTSIYIHQNMEQLREAIELI